jgi:hypothetical protein
LQKTALRLISEFVLFRLNNDVQPPSDLPICVRVTEYARRSPPRDFGKIESFDMNAAYAAAVCREGVDPDVILWVQVTPGRLIINAVLQ